ncbi:MAG TPA: YbaK/EbsC family protein [Thermomicrobiales bacterium]|nr:YbaK/EbsC family protein [Thermomicrobiales bacterium]
MSEPSTERVATFIAAHTLDAEIISTPDGVPTVETAALALGVEVDQIVKTLVFVDSQKRPVIAIACGLGKIDRHKLADAANTSKLKLAPADLVLETTGYSPGGVAPIDLPDGIRVIVDRCVAAQDVVYGGSGTDLHMMRIRTKDIIRLNAASIGDILQAGSP